MTEVKEDVVNNSWKFNWSELYSELGERRISARLPIRRFFFYKNKIYY